MADKNPGKDYQKSGKDSSNRSTSASRKGATKDRKRKTSEDQEIETKRHIISVPTAEQVVASAPPGGSSSASLFSRLRLTPGRRAQQAHQHNLSTSPGDSIAVLSKQSSTLHTKDCNSSGSKSSATTVGANASKNPREFWAGMLRNFSCLMMLYCNEIFLG